MAMFRVPWSLTSNRSFNYNGVAIVIGALKYNSIADRYYTTITVGDRKFEGVAIVSGVDLLQRFTTGLPPMYAFNTIFPLADPNPDNLLLVFMESI